MIDASIKIVNIDYTRTFQDIFPMALQKWEKMETENLMIRFLQKMRDASYTAALGILERLPDKSKDELLCAAVNLYGQDIRDLLNRYLEEDELGKNIRIGSLVIVQADGRLVLSIQDVQIDYKGLVSTEMVQEKIGTAAEQVTELISDSIRLKQLANRTANFAAKAAAAMAPAGIERRGITIIQSEKYKAGLLKIAERAMEKKGIHWSLEDFVLVQEVVDKNVAGCLEGKDGRVEFSRELEEDLLDSVTAYLKSLLEKD